MTELKCPFCGKGLAKDCDWVYGCLNRKCKAFGYFFGARELWQALIDTKKKLDDLLACEKELKKLDIAVDELEEMVDWYPDVCDKVAETLDEIKQIKDNKMKQKNNVIEQCAIGMAMAICLLFFGMFGVMLVMVI